MTLRVGILGIQHESNTFLDGVTTLDDFSRDVYAEGADVIRRMRDAHHEVGGFLAGIAAAPGFEAVPMLFARALPSGPISAECERRLIARALDLLRAAGPLDGLLVAPHGAGVSTTTPDFDGGWLAAVRSAVGPGVPIVCTIDPHANLSDAMVAACDAIVAYRTNPHVDQRDRGLEAAGLIVRHLRGEVRLVCSASRPPLIMNIERQRTAAEPCASLYRLAETVRARPGVMSASVVLGFPYSDVSEMGTSFVVVRDAGDAQADADELAAWTLARREDFVGRLISIDDAVRRAKATPGMSVLLDMGDNVGGGGPGTSTALIAALFAAGAGPTVATLFAADAARGAHALGVGRAARFAFPSPFRGETPFEVDATVVGLFDGRFTESQPRHGGATHFDMGPTAVLVAGPLTLIVTSHRLFPVSLEQYAACGLDIRTFRHVVAKGVHAPIAAYEALVPTFIHVNTPGVTSADLAQFEFRHRRRPLFPFEPISG